MTHAKAAVGLVVVLMLAPVWSPSAWGGIVAGPNFSASGAFETHPMVPGQPRWDIGDPDTGRVPVIFDPSAGPWIKQLRDETDGPFGANEGDVFELHEYLLAQDLGQPWEDWHEEIFEPGWEWGNVTIGIHNPDDPMNPFPLPGLQVVTMPTEEFIGGAVWFFFDPLPPNTPIDIWKELVFVGTDDLNPNEAFFGAPSVAEYPTPEPATLALVMIGSLMVLRRQQA